jgi:hypothetical protein
MTMTMQEGAAPRGRRVAKYTPENIQKIKDLVAQGISREEIAALIDVTVGSLQVTCSRLGIRLRTRQYSNGGGARWMGAVGRPHIANSPAMARQLSAGPRFQIALERNGVRQATDVPLTGFDIARLGLEAGVRDLGMAQLLSEVVTTAIKKNMIEEILREPSQESAPQAVPESP